MVVQKHLFTGLGINLKNLEEVRFKVPTSMSNLGVEKLQRNVMIIDLKSVQGTPSGGKRFALLRKLEHKLRNLTDDQKLRDFFYDRLEECSEAHGGISEKEKLDYMITLTVKLASCQFDGNDLILGDLVKFIGQENVERILRIAKMGN